METVCYSDEYVSIQLSKRFTWIFLDSFEIDSKCSLLLKKVHDSKQVLPARDLKRNFHGGKK